MEVRFTVAASVRFLGHSGIKLTLFFFWVVDSYVGGLSARRSLFGWSDVEGTNSLSIALVLFEEMVVVANGSSFM